MIYLLLLSVGLAMDAFSVCISYGVCQPKARFFSCLRLPISTGTFQFIMPILGWFGGKLIGGFLNDYSKWIAFAIFMIIGIKMIIDSLTKKEDCEVVDISKGIKLLIVSIATSIDAFAAGLSLGLLKEPLLLSAGLIGGITFVISLAGVYLGKFAGHILGKWADLFGGLILIGLAVKVFF
jgi:manganese efflux pump family protein